MQGKRSFKGFVLKYDWIFICKRSVFELFPVIKIVTAVEPTVDWISKRLISITDIELNK